MEIDEERERDETTPSRIGQLFDEIDARNRLRRDIILTRQATGIHDIHTREDMLAAVGRPVSAGAPVLTSDHTAKEQQQLIEAHREKLAPSYNDLWQEYWPIFQLGPKGKKGKRFLRGAERAWENHVASADVGRLPCNHVTSDMAELYIKTLPVGYDMKSKLLQRFRRLSKRAIKDDHISNCPFDEIKLSKARTTKDKIKFWHPETEYPLILKHARDETAREFFGFCMGTGARPNEALAFRWDDVDLENRTLAFRHGGSEDGATKGGEPATVSMVAEGEAWIRHIVDRKHGGTKPESGYVFTKKNGTHYRGNNQSFGLAEAVEAAGIKRDEGKLRYGFRHGFCVALANKYYGDHWSRDEAREMMRQDDEKVIDQYYRVLKPNLAEKAAQSKPITNPDDFSPKADGAIGADPSSNEDDFRGSERANPSESFPKEKGRPGTDRPFWKFAYLTTS